MSAAIESYPSAPRTAHEVALRGLTVRYSPDRSASGERLDSAVRGTLLANGLLIANTLLRSGATLLLMPFLISLLGKEQYALWISISTLTMYLSLSEAGLGQSVVNNVGEAYARGDLQRVGEIQATAHVLYWMLVIPTALVALVCFGYLPVDRWLLANADAHHGPLLISCLMVSTILALARIPMLVFPGLLTGLRQLPLRLACEMGATTLVALGTVLAAWLGTGLMGLTVVTNLTMLATTTAVGIAVTHRRPWAKLRLSQSRRDLLFPLAANSGYFFLISVAAVVDRSVLTLLVAKIGSLELAPAIFFLLNIFRVAAWSLISAMSRAVQPYVLMWRAHGQWDRIATVSGLMTKLTSVAAGLLVALFVPFAATFVDGWLGRGSFPGTVPLLLIVGTFLIDAVFLVSVNMLVVLNGHRKLAIMVSVKSLLVLALAVLCGRLASDSLIGLTAGVFIATVVGNAATPMLMRSAIGIERRRYVNHFLLRPTIFSAAVVAAAGGIAAVPSPTAKFVAAIGLAAAASAAAWSAVLDPIERRACRQTWAQLCRGSSRLANRYTSR